VKGVAVVIGVVKADDTRPDETHMPPRTSLAVPAGNR
jgi:hypothetical protein